MSRISAADLMARNAHTRRYADNSEPEPPAGLSVEARAEWKRITGLLRERKALDSLDQIAIRDLIVCWERLATCEADIQKRGVLIKGYRGSLVKNPSIQIARTYRGELRAWCESLGLTIASRSRLSLPQPEPPKVNRFALLDAQQEEDEEEE